MTATGKLDVINNPAVAQQGALRDGAGSRDGAAEHLIRIEGELRHCASRLELWEHLVNETAVLLPFGQSLVFREGPHWRVEAASGVAEVQRDSPRVRWYERMVDKLWRETGGDLKPHVFELPQYADPLDPCTADNALRHLLWVPLADGERLVGTGWLLARDRAWEEAQVVLAQRLGAAYAHGASAIDGRAHPARPWRRRLPRVVAALAMVLAVLFLVRLPLVTLAPMEVVPGEPFVVAAPVNGVVERMLVQPGAPVNAGDPLVQLVDTELRSDFEVAERRLEVARAKTLRLQQASVGDPDARRDLAVAMSEQSVARAERDYAAAMLDKAIIRARSEGVALYGDPRDWVGRPVAVGEAIMRVADPALVEYRIKVPVADAVNLRENARARIYLDAAPLDPIDAHLQRAAYKAEADAAGVANFIAVARADDGQGVPPRMGLRGTARISGAEVSLFYYLLRRPIVALRQMTGI